MVDAFAPRGGEAAGDTARRFFRSPEDEVAAADYVARCLPLYAVTEADHRDAIVNADVVGTFVAGEMQHVDLLPGLRRVTAPVLVLAGALDPICPPLDQEDLVAACTDAAVRLEIVANAGHSVYRDAPDASITILREFVASTP